MKVVLSRKGFDSNFGGYPSPILPNNELVSLPIPSNDKIKYSDLRLKTQKSYFDLMRKLNKKIKYNKKWHKLTKKTECHLDPDIYTNIFKRKKEWKPSLGQIGQSQSHLSNNGIKKGDLFLFFGWFKKTIMKNNKLSFDKHAPDIHIIFGYLQIGKKIQVNNQTKIPNWVEYHPHVMNKYRKKLQIQFICQKII